MIKIKSQILLEGRYDSLTRKVTGDIMKFLSETQGELGIDYIVLPEYDEKIKYESGLGFNFNVHLMINRVEYLEIKGKKQDFFVNTFIDDEDQITMEITISEEFEPYCYQRLFYKINEDIRHEIEHYTQKIFSDKSQSLQNTAEYETTFEHHMDPSEIEALTHGYYRRAKIEKLPFDSIVKRDLGSQVQMGNLTKRESDVIYQNIVSFAKKKLPKAIYSKTI
jgi:hypothetical protein